MLGAGAGLNALVTGIALAAGERAAELLPLAGELLGPLRARPAAGLALQPRHAGRWDAVILAVAAMTLCVVGVRLGPTWDG